MSAEIPICPMCHTPRMPRKKGEAWFWGCQNHTVCTVITTITPLVAQNLDDKGRNHGSQQVHTAGVGARRGGATFQPEFGGQICPDQSDRNSIPTRTVDGEDVPDHETVGVKLEPASQ